MADQDDDKKKQDQDQDEQKKKQIAQSIGTPIVPQQTQGEPSQPPNVQAPPPVQVNGSVGIPAYPIPAQDAAAHAEAQPAYRPKSTVGRVFDTIANLNPIGQAIEAGAGIGTMGHEKQMSQLEQSSHEEQGREKAAEGQQESQANVGEKEALAGEQTAAGEKALTEADIARKNAENVTITDSQGHVIGNVPRGKAEDLIKAMQQVQGRQGVTDTNVQGRKDVADINAGAKPAATKSIEERGKPHVMAWNPQTKAYDRDMGEAPPSGQGSAYADTATRVVFDDRGIPTVMQYDSATGRYDIPVGTSAAGAFGNRAAGAAAGQRAGDQVITDIQDYVKAHKDDYFTQLGTLGSWVSKNGLNTPIADQDLAGMQAELASFAALQPVIHGFRGTNAMDTFMKIIGGLQNDPDATIASIHGILKTIGQINPPKDAGNSGSQTFTDGGKTYHIPPDMVDEFKKDHPKATLQPASDSGESGSHIGAIEPRPLSPGEHLDNPPFKSTYSADEAQRYRDYLASLKRI